MRLPRHKPSAPLVAVVVLWAMAVVGAGAVAMGTARADAACGSHWVTTWATSPQGVTDAVHDQTLRTIAQATTGGDAVRITLSNRFGKTPVRFDDVTIALSAGGADLQPDTVVPVTFDGDRSVVVAPGTDATSDRAALLVATGDDLAVSFHVPGPSPLTVHTTAQRYTYATASGSGEHGADVDGAAFTPWLRSWVALAAVDVEAPGAVSTIAAIGDSLTDGDGATFGADTRWTDLLASKLHGRYAVVNLGIGGTLAARPFVPESHPLAEEVPGGADDRLGADVLARSGVTDLVVYVGINDVMFSLDRDPVASVIAADRRIVDQARRAGVRVIGATLTPGAVLDPREDAQRREINEWIRTSGTFDAVLDFDRAIADPAAPSQALPGYDHDGIHLTDAGYAAIAHSIDPDVFEGNDCAPPSAGGSAPRLGALDDDPRGRTT